MKKIEVRISPKSTGACPICKHSEDCKILDNIISSAQNSATAKSDNVLEMEIVIYRCPDFMETD